MWRLGRPSVELNEVDRLLPTVEGRLDFLLLDLQAPLGIVLWIGRAFPLWSVFRHSPKPAVSLPFVALACTGLIDSGYFFQPSS